MYERPAWTLLHARVHRTLKQRQFLEQGQSVLVAVSGGQDSLCLSKLLFDLQPKWHWTLAIAHCDHRWRPDSSANADAVRCLAQSWQLPYYQETAAQKINSEAEARQWRYQALSNLACQYRFDRVATGHTASDRAETLLYNLIRGSGADGLQALTWRRSLTAEIQLVRPLLEITRSETAQFCRIMDLKVWEDSTNRDLQYARNRIRRELLPYLQTHFNPQVEQALSQTAELLRADVDYLESQAADLLQQARHPTRLGLNRTVLRLSALALQRRVVRQFLLTVLPCAPSCEQIEKLTALITAPNRTQTDPFPGGTIAVVDQDWIWLTGP